MASEWVFNKIVHKKQTIDDLSAVVTGLLLALNLPATLPWWEAVIGGVFAIVVVKCLFGGLGQNFMNPALGARLSLIHIWCIRGFFRCEIDPQTLIRINEKKSY